ncbi:NUDIX domain-containing protein [Promicromonospora sukumoe]|uniref:8-oxo-dGTP diphosphatase n=1 Tax=Promicromonospora sukumoe TaxID=88382 RepID=A0A7W3JCI0_9MICO|nr:NUDIX hydrolase [Promicromonospora sukumoe]MBA8810277.1 8-oxo-dGTP diphosphatase [Promicromonospora sukumoe]
MTGALPAVAAAIIVQDRKLLLVQRRVPEGSLSWQFPAGAVEPGETFEQAAVRETAEEAGLTVQVVKVLGERVQPNTARLMGYVACDVISGEAYVADADELADIVWATPDKFVDYVPYGFAPAVQDYLAVTLA